MTYEVKKRPTYLGFDRDRTNPNRLTAGVLSVADQNENLVPPVNPPAGSSVLNILKLVGLVVAALAGSIVALQAGGVALPPVLVSIATAIVAIAAPLGLASPGLKSLQEKK